MLVIALVTPEPSVFQYRVFQTVLSLAVAGVAAMIPGFLQVNISGWIRAGGALGVFAVVYFYSPADLVVKPPAELKEHVFTDQKPTVVGIYPSDLFGPNQKNGLLAGINHFCDGNDIEIMHVDSQSYQQLKSGLSRELENQLGSVLKDENVFAISGPSITEITPVVLNTNKSTRGAPIFVTSAAPKAFLDWQTHKRDLPLYRISTGIDRRGREISSFIESLITNDIPIYFLVENGSDNQKSFGELFLAEISNYTNDFWRHVAEGRIDVRHYDRGRFSESSYERDIFDGKGVVFFLGVGTDYRSIVNNYYKLVGESDSNLQRPFLISWMHAHSINSDLNESDYLTNHIVEITDFDLSAYMIRPNAHYVFQTNFGEISPANRDEAFSFDAAMHICKAYKEFTNSIDIPAGKYVQFDQHALSEFSKIIDSTETEGVTGVIAFNANGDNPKGKIVFSMFRDLKWTVIDPNALMQTLKSEYVATLSG
ncbi:MAG: hypothetical protein WDZ30_13000 [Cellvibrionaceae bacterium]